MNANIVSASRLSFFKSERNCHGEHVFDASCCPRPHFCAGFLINGKAHFTDCTMNDKSFELLPGEMVFVPVGTRYVSKWTGTPDVEYISFHFLFDYPGIFCKNKNFLLQKVTFDTPEKTKALFERVSENYDRDEVGRLSALSDFFGFLSDILPRLVCGDEKNIDSRIAGAVEYIENNYESRITVETLSAHANMSESRFFPCFKAEMGVTPVDYLNHYRISRAIVLLVNREDLSVEEISAKVGFESATYFRRVFKTITGKNPRDYRRIHAEI